METVPKHFKDSKPIIANLNHTINQYEKAKARGKQNLIDLDTELLERLSHGVGHKMVLEEGNIYDETCSVTVLIGKKEIAVQLTDFCQSFSIKVGKDTVLKDVTALTKKFHSALPQISFLSEELIKKWDSAGGALYWDYHEATERLTLVKKRQAATRKWFIRPALIMEEDIREFLDTLNDVTLNRIMDEMGIETQYRFGGAEVIMEALTI